MPHESTVNPYASDELSARQSRSGSTLGLEAGGVSSPGADVAALTSHASANLADLTAASCLSRLSPVTYSNKNIYFGSTSVAAQNAVTDANTGETTRLENTAVKIAKQGSLNKPEQPSELTHYEDFDDDDEDSDESKMSNAPTPPRQLSSTTETDTTPAAQ